MQITFATPETIIQPKGSLIVEAPQEQDHVLGASGPTFDVICPDGHWTDYAPNPELQRNRFGDTFMCVSYSNNNAHEFLLQKQFGEIVNLSDLFLGVGSGTVRGRGNSKRAVAEWKRLNGAVLESDYPFLPDTTMDQAYAPLTPALLVKGLKFLDEYSLWYKWTPDNSQASVLEGLKYSPVQVDVLGSYKMNSQGYVIWDNENAVYAHEVIVFDYELGKCWHVYDSETQQFVKFDWGFPFGSPMIHQIKKTHMITIFKEKSKPALAVKHPTQNAMIAFSGGPVVASDLFFALYGIKDFSQLPITEVDKFPSPVVYLLNTVLDTGATE